VISFNKGFKASFVANMGWFKSRAFRTHLVLERSQALWIGFGSSRLEDGDRQEDFGLF